MFFHRTPSIVQRLYPSLTWSKNTKKTIYLTFDDGPIPVLTPFIQKTLSEFNVLGTFFCVGDNLKKYPDIALAAIESGHAIGNHTFNHLNGWRTDKTDYLDNIQQCEILIKELGVNNRLFRPPYGRIKTNQIRRVKKEYDIVMWDVLTGDFSRQVSPEDCLTRSVKATNDGSIVLFHDNMKAEKNLKFTLPRYIEHFLNKGFQFNHL